MRRAIRTLLPTLLVLLSLHGPRASAADVQQPAPELDAQRQYQEFVDNRAAEARARLSVLLSSSMARRGDTVRVLISLDKQISLEQAALLIKEWGGRPLALGHQVTSHIGGYAIPEGMSVEEALANYQRDYASYMDQLVNRLTEQTGSEDRAIAASAGAQLRQLGTAKREVLHDPPSPERAASWPLQITGIEMEVDYSTLRVIAGFEHVAAIEVTSRARRLLPLPIVSEVFR